MPIKIKERHGKFTCLVWQDGKNGRKSFDTEQEARTFVDVWEMKKKAKKNAVTPIPDEDLDKSISKFINFTLGGKREKTIINVRSTLKQSLAEINWRKLDRDEIYTYCKDKKYRTTTCRFTIKWIKSFCKFNEVDISKIDWKLLSRALTKENDKIERIGFNENASDMDSLLKAVSGNNALIIKYMSSCAIRVREMTRLDVEDFNADTWTVTLPAHKAKAKKSRTNIVANEIREEFKKYTNAFSDNKKLPLFHIDGKRISPDGFSHRFSEWCHKAGIGKRNIHLLRAYAIIKILKTCCGDYELVRNMGGWDSEEIQKYFGKMESAKTELAANMTFQNTVIDSTREMDVLVNQLNLLDGTDKLDIRSASAKSGISYGWLFNFMTNKKSHEIENLLKLVKHYSHRLEVYEVRGKPSLDQ